MSDLQEIQSAIELLPKVDAVQLLRWMQERDWKEWDNELTKDASEGKLDFLIQEAKLEKENGTLRDL